VSQPDAAFAIGVESQFAKNPGMVHWDAVKKTIVYLLSMKDLWLTFGGKNREEVEGYCNSDWGGQLH
jgi:hypothetical protein